MRIITTISACALIAFAAPAFAQSDPGTTTKEMQNNGSSNSMGGSKMKQPGSADTQSGTSSGMSEGRGSATDPNGAGAAGTGAAGAGAGGATKMGTSPGPTNGNMAPGGGPGESGK